MVKELNINTGACSSSWKPISELRSVGCHITQAQVNMPHLNPSQAGRYLFTYPEGIEGWVDLDGWLYTKIVYLSKDSAIKVLTGLGVGQLHWLDTMC